jgi:hypothetical protein
LRTLRFVQVRRVPMNAGGLTPKPATAPLAMAVRPDYRTFAGLLVLFLRVFKYGSSDVA